MSWPAYPSYQDTNSSHFGAIPSHWQIAPLKRFFRIVGGSTPKSDVPAYWDGDVVWVTPGDLSGLSSFEIEDSARRVTQDGLASCGSRLIPTDSIILSTRAPIGSVAIAGTELSTNQGCKSLVPGTDVDSQYFAYLLQSSVDRLNSLGKGTTFLELSGDALGGSTVLVPPLDEQNAIAGFLQRETARVDVLIAKQERLIELLGEKRQALITRAVTKGLDPSVPMKDSGVDFLGKVPISWQVGKLSRFLPFQEGPGILAESFREEGVALLRVANVGKRYVDMERCGYLDSDDVARRWSHFQVELGDLLISASASMGVVSEVGADAVGSVPYTGIIRVFPSENNVLRDYARLFLVSGVFLRQIEVLKTGATIQHFGPSHLRQMHMAVPPVSEQEKIVNLLESKIDIIDRTIDKAEQAVERISEHRAALISAAVTGKIDVREAA